MKEAFQKMVAWVKSHSLLLRLIFFGSILIFVVNQVVNIAHGMSWQEVLDTMKEQRRTTLVQMALIGLGGVLPMLGYDLVTVQSLEKQGKPKMPLWELLRSAWITNTINNLAGFGGIIGASLRTNFYGQDIERRKVLATVSKVALFMFSGLSLWAFILVIEIFFYRSDSHYQSYWIWLVGGSLYAPALLVISYLRRKKLFADLFPLGVLKLFVTSFCQWSCALLVFLAIGRLMNVAAAPTEVFPMFLIATLIGMLTMVPGGMGTFDVLMILGLSQLGVQQGTTLVWLLYYRLFYYLVPFLSGILLYLSYTGVKINRFFDNLPRLLLQKIAHLIVVVAVYAAGIMMVLLSTVTNLSNLSQIFQVLLPFSFNFLDQTLNLLVGFLLLGLARALYAKVKRAYLPTIALLIFGIVNTVSRTRSLRLIVVYCLILLAVWLARHEFYRKRFVYSWGAMIFDLLLFGGLFIVYAVAGYHSGQWWNNEVLGDRFLLFPSDEIWFSGLIGLAISLLTLFGLYGYLSQTDEELGEGWDEARFDHLLTRYPGTKSSHRLRLSGYRYFYYQREEQDRVVFGYQIRGNRLFVLGNPVGEKAGWKAATLAFIEAADQFDYQLAFFKVEEEFVVLLHDLGFNFMKIGETGTVALQNNQINFSHQVQYRKLATQGYHFTLYDKVPKELRKDIEKVSDEWLAGKAEKHFANGRLDWEYVLQTPMGVVRNKANKVVGFITQQPISRKWVSYDLLRVADKTPEDLSNFLVMNMLDEWRKQGYELVDLGLAPLAQVGEGRFSFFEERLMKLIYNYGNSFYAFQTNFAGKQPYADQWESSYFAYVRGGSFYLAGLQLLSLIGRGKPKGPTLVEEVILEE